jgi:phage tail sheath protein FI
VPGYRTPGVYYESVDAGALPVTPFRTDIAGFVGLAERGPIDLPVAVESWQQFTSWFGSFVGFGFLAYAVRAFFENGGGRCWVVRVASDDPAGGARWASTIVRNATGPAWLVRASTPGAWGNALTVNLRERNRAQRFLSRTDGDGLYSTAADVSGLAPAVLVRLTQEGASAVAWRVVSEVDALAGRVFWVHPDRERRTPYDRPLTTFDPDRPVLLQSLDYTMTVSERGRLIRVYERLSLVPSHPRYAPLVLPGPTRPEDPRDVELVELKVTPPEPVTVEELRVDLTDVAGLEIDPFARVALVGGRDGLAPLAVGDFIGEPVLPEDGPAAIATKRRGLRALEDIAEVALLAVPDAQPAPVDVNPVLPPEVCIPDPCIDRPPEPPVVLPSGEQEPPPAFSDEQLFRVQSELVLQCERRRDRFALLDPPRASAHGSVQGIRAVLDWRARFDSPFAALYFPWVRVADPLRSLSGVLRSVPPSGYVAGQTAKSDLERGVHRAPANEPLAFAHGASLVLGDEHHGTLNSAGVNAIRVTAVTGLRVLGARTLSSDVDWRFLNVRRLMSMIEEVLETALQWAVYEPNTVPVRARVALSVTFFLLTLHEAGMLAGETPEESFFVKCDLDNNPESQRELGQLVVEVGVAPTKPLEFLIFRVGRVVGAMEVSEVGSARMSGVGA